MPATGSRNMLWALALSLTLTLVIVILHVVPFSFTDIPRYA
jgi:hypothetical protein